MAANDKEVLMKADHVKVYFKGKKKGQTVKAVDDVSFEIMKGETFGVVGESGCGKSTLGRTLIRLQQPTDGHIYLNGTDIAGLKGAQLKEMRREAQIIFQDPSACLNPRRTIKQILMEPFEIHNLKGKIDVDAKIMELLQLVGLDSYHLSRYPHELSGGQKQRIGIARALALEPQIIICDEAVSALDVSVQAQVLNLLQELKQKLGLTYFFISHNLNVVYQVDQTEQKERIHLEGEVPSPYDPPSGCHFHTRCPKACDKCRQVVPELKEVAPGHYVACHLYE